MIPTVGDRLDLPGPRWAWGLLATAALTLPFALHALGGAPDGQRALAGLEVEVRYRNVAWLLARQAQRDVAARLRAAEQAAAPAPAAPYALARATTVSDGDDDRPTIGRPRPAGVVADHTADPTATGSDRPATGPRGAMPDTGTQAKATAPGAATTPLFDQALGQTLDALHAHARRIGERHPALADQALELVVAHAIATESYRAAAPWLAGRQRPSDALRAALAVAAHDSDVAAELGAMTPDEAAEVMATARYGATWSPFVRTKLRARIAALTDDRGALRAQVAVLHAIEDRVYQTLTTLMQVVFLALFAGVGLWLYLVLRALTAGSSGRLAWLTDRFAGPATEQPWPRDGLLPLLGLASWVAGYHAAALLMALMPSARPLNGLAVLFQTLAGLVVAIAVTAALGRGRTPLQSVGLSDARVESSGLRAATWSLLVFCLLLPVMLVTVLLSEVLAQLGGGDGAEVHLAVQMLLGETDPLQIGALVVATVIAAPLAEEIVFRGLLYRSLRDLRGRTVAVWVSSAAFAVLHMAFPTMLPLFVLGVAFALTYEWTGSLWANVTLHALWNGMIVAASIVITQT